MELTLLNSQFKRESLIENWNSLIWTERYSRNGDFELTSNDISETLNLLPIGAVDDPPTLIAISDSEVPMVVETHRITKKKDGTPQIITSGRSFETVLDRRQAIRAVTSGVARADWSIAATSSATAAYEGIKEIIEDGAATALDIIPEITLLNSVADVGASETYAVEAKELYAWAIETLAIGKYGMKSELAPALNKIAVIIYKGTDRHTSVVFDVALDQFNEAAYLLSNVGYKNVMITATKNGMEFSSIGSVPSGLQRRVGFQDLATEITIAAGAPLTNLTINKGKVTLADLLPIALFSGEVSLSIGAEYKSTYFLGDIVTLQGEYGLSQTARVAEFVRSQDTSGYKAYPTFESITL